jgi:hypothetical protein
MKGEEEMEEGEMGKGREDRGRVVDPDPDPAGSEIICMVGSGSII